MSEVTQPGKARGKVLPAAFVAAALFALLALAPVASAAPDPVASGSTTLTLSNAVAKGLKAEGISIKAIKPAKLKGTKATFKVTKGTFDPTTGAGMLTHSGGLKLSAGKKSVAIKSLEVNSSKKGLFGKVGGKKVKVAAVAGVSFSREGFGAKVTIKKVKLTGNAANVLNKKLGFTSGPKPIKANRSIGKATSKEQPKETALVPGGAMTFAVNAELAKKLNDVEAKIVPLTGTTTLAPGSYSFPVTGGTFSATGTAGTIQSGGGLELTQKLPTSATTALETQITLAGFYYDLAAKTITVEVTAKSNASPSLNLGALGRSSVADVTIGGVIADPTTRSVSIQNSSAVLQVVSGEVLNGFVVVAREYYSAGLQKAGKTKAEADAAAAAKYAPDAIAAGNPLGLISFTGQAQ